MGAITLFKFSANSYSEIQGTSSNLEKPLQLRIEENLEVLLGIRFIATEHSTGKRHGGRIDTLGLDEDNYPVIIEYKRSTNEAIINQGLYYLDWLMDHQAEFNLLVQKNLNVKAASEIDWSLPRLLCVAAEFSKYDIHAVQQIGRSIELLRYRNFGDDLLLLEFINVVESEPKSEQGKLKRTEKTGSDRNVAEALANSNASIKSLFDALETYIHSFGDDIQRKDLKLYIAFKRLKNFVTVCFQKNNLLVYLKLDPEKYPKIEKITRDVREIGHWGRGDLELSLESLSDLEKVKFLLEQAYHGGEG